jgi:hypothetical protein
MMQRPTVSPKELQEVSKYETIKDILKRKQNNPKN